MKKESLCAVSQMSAVNRPRIDSSQPPGGQAVCGMFTRHVVQTRCVPPAHLGARAFSKDQEATTYLCPGLAEKG